MCKRRQTEIDKTDKCYKQQSSSIKTIFANIRTVMDNMILKFTQIALGEFKTESPTDFCLNSLVNDVVLYSNANEFYTMEMLYSCDFLNNVPFLIKNIKVSEEKPLANLVKDIDCVEIYENSSVLECQELAIDHIFITECATEAPKARLLKAEFVPGFSFSRLCCALTSYGLFILYTQDSVSMKWHPLKANLNQILMSDVFPIKKSPTAIKTFADLRKYVDTYYITAFAWCTSDTLFVGTAAGCIMAFKYFVDEQSFALLYKIETSLERIYYLTTKNNILLAACSQGQVQVLMFNHNEKQLKLIDFLWSKKDRMSCRKAVITYDDVLQSYLVLFCKAAHLLAYRLDLEGRVISKSSAHVTGIKITGLECFDRNEFIITTIMCGIQHATISYPSAEELKIQVHKVEHDLDMRNFQILGLAASNNRSIWTLLLFRNKEYTHQSKYTASSALLSCCKCNTKDSLIRIQSLRLPAMNNAQDLLVAINMDVNNNCNVERYQQCLDFSQLCIPLDINDVFVQDLQIKFIILRQIAKYQKMKYKAIKRNIELKFAFLEAAIQRLHILKRLQYLRSQYPENVKLSPFQKLSIACMQTQFLCLFSNQTNVDADSGDNFEVVIENFTKITSDIFEEFKYDISTFNQAKEFCWMCHGEISLNNFIKCDNGHEIKRCTVSYVQLPFFATKHCPNCFALVTNDDGIDLMELFEPTNVLTCTFCRYMLKNDVLF